MAICSRAQGHLDAALARLPGAIGLAADLTDAAAAAVMVGCAEQGLGPLDILVNSAGAAKRTPPDELTPAAWHAAMDAKFFSYIHVIDPVIKLMTARKAGVIINIIGNGGKGASPTHLAGGAANAALMLVTAGLANTYAGSGVRVAGLNPGLTETDRVAEGLQSAARLAGATMEEMLRESIARIPLGRMARPEEIASLVAFLAGDGASYMTATTVFADGGIMQSSPGL